jgi:hypothetical protein
MPRIAEISDKFFNRDGEAQTLTEFADALIAEETKNGDVGINVTSQQDFMVNGTNVYPYLTDRGTGRVYDGLKSLELMSRVIKGVSLKSASLFDAKIIAFTPEDMKGASDEVARTIVNSNLGLKEVYEFARVSRSKELAAYDIFIKKIVRQIKAGGFRAEDHITEALVRVKALVKTTINPKVVR